MVSHSTAVQSIQAAPITKTKESPVKWCSVSLSEVLDRGKRFEASVFDVDGRQAREVVKKGRYGVAIVGGENGLANAYTCPRFKRIWVNSSDYPIFQPSSILDIKPEPSGYISKLTKTDIDALRVRKGQLLLTCSGTIGNVALVSDTLDNKIFSHDLLRVECKEPEDVGYLYAYFKSKVGNKILLTNGYGAVVTHVEAEHLTDVIVPNPPGLIKQRINSIIMRSYELRDESNELLSKATQLLIDELKLPPIHELPKSSISPNADVGAFCVKLSHLRGRVDASYHVPIVDSIIEHLQANAAEVTTVADSRISKRIILPGRFKRVYVEEGYGRIFIGGKQLWELDPVNKKYLSIAHHSSRISSQLELHENMILVTCSGTIGKITLVPRHWEHWTANQHIIRIVPAGDDIAGYLSVFLASQYGYHLITRFVYGSVVDEIDNNHVSQVQIPLLRNKDVQQEINDLALEANAKRYEAYLLEQEALSILDEEVLYAKP